MRFLSQACFAVGLITLTACADGTTTEPTFPSAGNGGSGGAAAISGSTGGSSGAGGASGAAGSGGSGAGGFTGTGGSAGVAGGAGMAGIGGSGSGGAAGDGSMASGSWWKPTAGLSWQWQIGGGEIDASLDVDVFDIDWEESANTVQELHDAGKKVICYVSVGSWEDWRPDADDFPSEVVGNDYPDWPGEKFVDIRAQELREVMAKRLDACQDKGFDAVEPDNMDVFSSDSGFPLTDQDGVDYALWLATESHNRGLAIVQKNASEITSRIESVYDGALTEGCYEDGNWCSDMEPYLDANKPVFACEYDEGSFEDACSWGASDMYSFILKGLDLDGPITFCP